MFAALRDCVPTMKWSRHLESPQVLLESFEKEVDGYMKDKILDPLCRALEEDLRLSSHLHLQLDDRNPFKVPLLICIALYSRTAQLIYFCDNNFVGSILFELCMSFLKICGELVTLPILCKFSKSMKNKFKDTSTK